eukprot:GFKZ01003963.1.p3 GENE.GFKZ01003963.1~~GFKZ01003963.1.p3  ORF type:complete len:102 (-),score=8.46 GFKZ01003963.1:452-757(-)
MSSLAAAWTGSVSFFRDRGFEQKMLNGSLSGARHEEFHSLNAALASGYVAKSAIAEGSHCSHSLFVWELEARKAAATMSLAEVRPFPRVGFLASIGLSGSW